MSEKSIVEKQVCEILRELNGVSIRGMRNWSEEEIEMYVRRYAIVLGFLPKLAMKARVLEIGLLNGGLAFSIKRFSNLERLSCLEYPATVKMYTRDFLKLLKKEKIELKACDLNHDVIPWKEEVFDVVVCSEVMEHLVPVTAVRMVSGIHRVLKPGGRLLLTTPNVASFLKRMKLLLGKNFLEFDPKLHEGGTYGHVREYTMREVCDLLQSVGFTIEQMAYVDFDELRSVFTQIESTISSLLPSFGNGLVVWGRK